MALVARSSLRSRLRLAIPYGATAGALVLAGAALRGPWPPREVAGAGLVAYVLLLVWGAADPAAGLFVDAHCTVPDGVALTFDGGPEPKYTLALLDALEAKGARGTFFFSGERVVEQAALVKELLERGHLIGGLGYAEQGLPAFSSLSEWLRDAREEKAAWAHSLGFEPVLYRPPSRWMSPRVGAVTRETARSLVGWTEDLRGISSAETLRTRALHALHRGAILRCSGASHPNRPGEPPVVLEVLPAILDALEERKLASVLVPLDESRRSG